MNMETKQKSHEKFLKYLKNLFNKRLKIPYYLRLMLIGILIALLLISAISANAAISSSDTIQEIVPIYSYTQTGKFDYTVFLKNNRIFDDVRYLRPGQGIIFRKLIDSINGSYNYKINTGSNARIFGNFSLALKVKTNLWAKSFELIPEKTLDSSGNFLEYSETFPIDYLSYEDLINQIDKETDIWSKDHKLIIQFNCLVTIKIKNDIIKDSFQQQLSLNLSKKTLDFSERLTYEKHGSKNTEVSYKNNGIIDERNIWTSSTCIFFVLLFLSVFLTRGDKENLDKIERKARKIQRKFSEFLVDVKRHPKRSVNFDVLYTKTFEDLLKISEEIGRPIIHYKTENNSHTYHVIDNLHQYQFILS